VLPDHLADHVVNRDGHGRGGRGSRQFVNDGRIGQSRTAKAVDFRGQEQIQQSQLCNSRQGLADAGLVLIAGPVQRQQVARGKAAHRLDQGAFVLFQIINQAVQHALASRPRHEDALVKASLAMTRSYGEQRRVAERPL
jgi:transcription initiation factor TFIID subunit TAF12